MRTVPRSWGTTLRLGNNGYVDCGTPSALLFGGQASFVIEAWVRPSALPATGVTHAVATRYATHGYGLGIDANGCGFGWRESPDGTLLAAGSTKPLTIDEWHYLAVVYDGASLTNYVDGVPTQSVSGTNPIGDLSAVPFRIGAAASWPSWVDRFAGDIGEVIVWNAARGIDAINDDAVRWDVPSDPSLVAWCEFGELPFRDWSASGLTLTLQTSAPLLYVPALLLGGEALANCGETQDLSFGGTAPYTIEGWIGSYDDPPTGIVAARINEGVNSEYAVYVDDESRPAASRQAAPWNVAAPVSLSAGDWYHVAASYDGVVQRLYVNGNLQGAVAIGAQPSAPGIATLIGAKYASGVPTGFYQGAIQNVRFWSRCLDQGEIRQWMDNDPIDDEHLVADFDFTVDPPIDTTDKHTITLYDGARVGTVEVWIDPSSEEGRFGFVQPGADQLLDDDPATPPSAASMPRLEVPPVPPPFSEEHFELLLASLARDGPDRQRLEAGFRAAYERARLLYEEDPRIGSVTDRVEDGYLILTHHTRRGDIEVFRAPAGTVDPCTVWWMTFIYQVTYGFLVAVGWAPGAGDAMAKVYGLVSKNAVVMQALKNILLSPITLATALSAVAVLWKEGLLWPIIKMAAPSVGWWTLAWLLRRAIIFLGGAEVASMLSGFIVWAGQLLNLQREYTKNCP
jgi:hypothetical protein